MDSDDSDSEGHDFIQQQIDLLKAKLLNTLDRIGELTKQELREKMFGTWTKRKNEQRLKKQSRLVAFVDEIKDSIQSLKAAASVDDEIVPKRSSYDTDELQVSIDEILQSIELLSISGSESYIDIAEISQGTQKEEDDEEEDEVCSFDGKDEILDALLYNALHDELSSSSDEGDSD